MDRDREDQMKRDDAQKRAQVRIPGPWTTGNVAQQGASEGEGGFLDRPSPLYESLAGMGRGANLKSYDEETRAFNSDGARIYAELQQRIKQAKRMADEHDELTELLELMNENSTITRMIILMRKHIKL